MQSCSRKAPRMTVPCEHMPPLSGTERNASFAVILRLIQQHGRNNQTGPMRRVWTTAAKTIHHCLAAHLSGTPWQRCTDQQHPCSDSTYFQDLRDTAARHHDAGVPLELYNGLLKLYRRIYLNHLTIKLNPAAHNDMPLGHTLHNPKSFMACLNAFFDKVELISLAPWTSDSAKDGVLKQNLRRLARERDQYFAALESLHSPIFIADEHGDLITANRAALDTFLDCSQIGTLTYRLALPPHRSELQHIADKVFTVAKKPVHAVWMQTRHGKRCFDILIRETEGAVDKLENWHIILMHDVTEHYQTMQRALEAERAMSSFLAAMSHEIRAPLHSVLGAAGLVKGARPEDVDGLIDLLDISARSLNATLDNVLNFSRFEHQAPQPSPVPVILADALHDLVRIKGIYARQQNVPVRLDMVPDVPHTVLLDWSMTQQILNNLVRNALHHDDGRGVSIGVRAQSRSLIFRIADHGPGLQKDIRDMLANPPAELRPRITGKNGAGLGLAIAQRMTHAMGGTIAALHRINGTLIEVHLPLVTSDVLPAAPTHQLPPNEQLDIECLLLDDDPINAKVTIAMLTRIGLTADHAYTLDQAQAFYQADPEAYKVFIIDYQLSEGSGVDFARYLRRDPSHQDTPIFLLSANVEWIKQSPQDACLFTALLEKPMDAASLAQAIRKKMHPKRTANMLDGLSLGVQHKMAGLFSQQWSELQQILLAAPTADQDKDIAIRAHKLSSGAAIFGLISISDALKKIEWAHTDPAADNTDRVTAHKALLICTLAHDWFHQSGVSQ